MDTNFRTVAKPVKEPLTLKAAKDHLRLDHEETVEDELLRGYIVAARVWCEDISGRSFIERTIALSLDKWPSGGMIRLPRPPAVSIESIAYRDAIDGTVQQIDPADYELDTKSEPARLRPAPGKSWPAVGDYLSAIEITYKAGYGLNPEDLDDNHLSAIRLKLADIYENRESIIVGTSTAESLAAESFLEQDRIRDGNYAEDR